MCVIWFIFLPYVDLCQFLKTNLLDDILVTLYTQHHVIKAERSQTKSGNGAIGYRRILP